MSPEVFLKFAARISHNRQNFSLYTSLMDTLPPRPGVEFQVIGAGLPRTGTTSFCAALSILLDGPACHNGMRCLQSPDERYILSWMKVMELRPYQTEDQKQQALNIIAEVLDGYTAVADIPPAQLVPELLELYPDAKVICTVRDPEKWAASILRAGSAVTPGVLSFVLFWVPIARHFGKMVTLAHKLYEEIYGIDMQNKTEALETWRRHELWLKQVVPKEQLFFVDMKDGWGPLCKALEVPVPKDVPFPHLNDMQGLEDLFKKLLLRGVLMWVFVFAVAAVVISGLIAVYG